MQIDAVDIVGCIFLPPIGALVVYWGGYTAGRVVTGGQPLSQVTKIILRYISFFVLGMGYLIMILGTLKLPDSVIWASSILWGILVIGLAKWRQRKSEDAAHSPRT